MVSIELKISIYLQSQHNAELYKYNVFICVCIISDSKLGHIVIVIPQRVISELNGIKRDQKGTTAGDIAHRENLFINYILLQNRKEHNANPRMQGTSNN